jgi:hypothetical protein
MEEGGRTGSGLRVARQCRSAQAGDVADLTRARRSGGPSRLELSLPVARLDTNGRRRLGRPPEKIFRLPDPSASGLRWDSLRSPFAAKILCLRPGASRRSPSARVSRLRLCFVVPAVTDIATWRKPQNMLVQTNRAGGALRFRFRLSSVNTTVACQVM